MNSTRYDQVTIKATVTPNGWIKDTPVITRSGIFVYKRADGTTIREYRSPEAVFDEASLVSLHGVPITDGHNGLVTADNTGGIIGTVVGPGVKQDNNVVADIVIHNSKKLGKRREISLGYTAKVDDTPGYTPDGEHYDATQTNIKYNHLAVVDKGRAGNARLRLDGNMEIDEMDPIVAKIGTKEYRLDSLDANTAMELKLAIGRAIDEVAQRPNDYDAVQAQRDTLKGQVAEAAMILQNVAEIVQDSSENRKELPDKVKQAIDEAKVSVKKRMELEEIATKHEVKFDEKTTDRQIKEAVVKVLRGDEIKFDEKSDDYVNSAFDMSVQFIQDKAVKIGKQRQQLHKPPDAGGDKPIMGSQAYRQQYVNSIRAGRS